jgi:spore coat protein U-like protein
MRAHLVVGALLILAGWPVTPMAQTLTATSGMPVRIEIIASCTVSAADLDFGAYSPGANAPKMAQTTVQLHCSAGVVVEVGLDAGSGSGSTKNRRMEAEAGGSGRLDYELYQDAARTIHWGDKSGKDTRELLATGAAQAVPVYGQIPAGQNVGSGTYSDVITVQVQF